MAKGLHFGRTFCNCLARLALTILREEIGAWGYEMVREGFVGLTENKRKE